MLVWRVALGQEKGVKAKGRRTRYATTRPTHRTQTQHVKQRVLQQTKQTEHNTYSTVVRAGNRPKASVNNRVAEWAKPSVMQQTQQLPSLSLSLSGLKPILHYSVVRRLLTKGTFPNAFSTFVRTSVDALRCIDRGSPKFAHPKSYHTDSHRLLKKVVVTSECPRRYPQGAERRRGGEAELLGENNPP